MSSWRSTKDGRHFQNRSKPGISSDNDNNTSLYSGSQPSPVVPLTRNVSESEARMMASIKLTDAQKEAREIRVNFFNKFSDAINEYGNEICWVGFNKVMAENPKPENMAEADYEGTMITLKKKTRAKIAEILTETRKTTAPKPASTTTTTYERRTPQASPNKPASDNQLRTMRKLCNQVSRIYQFDSCNGTGASVSAEYREKTNNPKLSSRDASDAIGELIGYIEDEM